MPTVNTSHTPDSPCLIGQYAGYENSFNTFFFWTAYDVLGTIPGLGIKDRVRKKIPPSLNHQLYNKPAHY